jgi:tRNA dimethylallyltransferase
MDIGTAKPNHEEMNAVTHHLVDVADPDETWSLARYLQACLEAVEELHVVEVLPLLVGGTGQYYRSLIEGWVPPTTRISEAFREKMEAYARKHGQQALHEHLRQVDPDSAERIDGRNVRRVIRALEILHLTGIPASVQRKRETPAYPILTLGLWLPRDVLYARIDQRIDHMLAQGWLKEVHTLLHDGYSPDLPAFSAIGYRELAAHLQGKLSLEEAVQRIRHGSRQFVRRQANWFKRTDERIHWFENTPGVVRKMKSELERWVSAIP